MTKLILTGPTPVAQRIGKGFIPVVYDPDRGPQRYPRKAKATLAEAIEYARRTIHYRRVRANEKGRRIEALEHPRFTTWGGIPGRYAGTAASLLGCHPRGLADQLRA